MNPQKTGYTRKSGDKGYVFYYRCPRAYGYDGECSHRKNHRADSLEPAVWGLVAGLLKEPERIREGLEQLIEEERQGMRGDPVQEQAVWLRKLAEADQRRASFQDMAAEGLITFDELRKKLAALEEPDNSPGESSISCRNGRSDFRSSSGTRQHCWSTMRVWCPTSSTT